MKFDLLLIGSGLANALIALKISEQHPRCRIGILERAPVAVGEKIWSYYDSDLGKEQAQWMDRFKSFRWPGYSVRFGSFERSILNPYASIRSSQIRSALELRSNIQLICESNIVEASGSHAATQSGECYYAYAVIDGRGSRPSAPWSIGCQKFVGLEVELEVEHGLSSPVIMDADVEQKEGYRFVYLLPFSDTRMLVEDTRYSDVGAIDRNQIRSDIESYLATQGWKVSTVHREETGILPILLAMDFNSFWPVTDRLPRSGLRAGLFQPTTGYSLPQAVDLAFKVASAWPMNSQQLAVFTRDISKNHFESTWFYRFLNRMLFRAGNPHERDRVFERFYGLPESLIKRFYASKINHFDKARLVSGKPPLPFFESLRFISERKLVEKEITPISSAD